MSFTATPRTQADYQQTWEDSQKRFKELQDVLMEAGKMIVRYAELTRPPANPGELLSLAVSSLQTCTTQILQSVEPGSGKVRQPRTGPQAIIVTSIGGPNGQQQQQQSRKNRQSNTNGSVAQAVQRILQQQGVQTQ